jgi:AcrR family transcriptional regulator
MPRAGLDTDRVVAAAARIADEQGLAALSLAGLASELGVRPPSLYAHVDGLDDLRRRVALRGVREFTTTLQKAAAGRANGDALRAVAQAYRAWALEHPGAYAAFQRAPSPDDPEAMELAKDVVDVVLAVLRGYGIEGDDALHATRAIRAALHGFVAIEAAGGFGLPLDIDESFNRLVSLLDAGLTGMNDPHRTVAEPEAG